MEDESKRIKSLEKQAQSFWDVLLECGLSDGHCKSYDPLTIDRENDSYTFRSYLFDYGDGGRSRSFSTLDEGQVWLLKSFQQWLERDDLIQERCQAASHN